MTQEQKIRNMIMGFLNDPPDTDYQQGFLAATIVIANEVMGFKWNDPLLEGANKLVNGDQPDVVETITKVKAALTVIDGGKSIID